MPKVFSMQTLPPALDLSSSLTLLDAVLRGQEQKNGITEGKKPQNLMSGYLVLVILKKEPGRSQNKAFTSGSGEGTNPLNETNQGEKKEICYCFLCVVLFKQRRPKLHRSWPLGLLNSIHFYNERIDVSSSSVKGHITESTCPLVDDIHNCRRSHFSEDIIGTSHSL